MTSAITVGRRRHAPRTTRIRWRRSVNRLTAGQAERFQAAWAKLGTLSDERGFAYHAGRHGLPLPVECPHSAELFLPWHRAYLYFFEMALREVDPQVTLPWWGWPSGALPGLYADPASPLHHSPIPPVARVAGGPAQTFRVGPADLPKIVDVRDALQRSDFLDFSEAVENLHNWVHGSIGGTMGSIANAAFDPIFWVHHCYVDRLWRLWQLRNPAAQLPASLLGQALGTFPMTVGQTVSVAALGYDYARSTVSISTEA